MITLIPKPDDVPERRQPLSRVAWLAASGCVIFAVVSVGLVRLLPLPHNRAGYLMIGTLASLAAIITMFVGLLLTRSRPESK